MCRLLVYSALHQKETVDLVTFTEEILNAKSIFCAVLVLAENGLNKNILTRQNRLFYALLRFIALL